MGEIHDLEAPSMVIVIQNRPSIVRRDVPDPDLSERSMHVD
jgi:hypothetical protein